MMLQVFRNELSALRAAPWRTPRVTSEACRAAGAQYPWHAAESPCPRTYRTLTWCPRRGRQESRHQDVPYSSTIFADSLRHIQKEALMENVVMAKMGVGRNGIKDLYNKKGYTNHSD